jgi:hypothetical protein
MALQELMETIVNETDITVVEMKQQEPLNRFTDSIHNSNEISLVNRMSAWGVIGGVLGIIYGSQLKWGPIAIGLLGLFMGSLIGLFWKRHQQKTSTQMIDMLLLVHCQSQEQARTITAIFRKYFVLILGIHK